ncbi:hypothetical protein K1T71_008095 [Dendrolimus kikuchii]|uniref:Uncharacterized protein n=1 Tax=Dendrolimus kikuchii TaxID=765133 RepID=A0ACC1CW29_9NEOP|nr:hypothetical protein K1T71_008095 [Dendrolimus kikuchii]
MNKSNSNYSKKYNRVMPRVYNRSASSIKSLSNVVRHEIPSSVRLGAKTVVPNVSSSGVFNELPIVLNDFKPDSTRDKLVKKRNVVKPRKTIESLDPALSPYRSPPKFDSSKRAGNTKTVCSAPALLASNGQKWTDEHFKGCLSSRSHTKLKEIKAEIKAYDDNEKYMRLRSSLYKKCGVVLDDVGQVAEDKAVQKKIKTTGDPHLSQQRHNGENARAPMSHEQMRSEVLCYPVDRYLVESSKNLEMVNIIDEDIWNPEPTLRPEDDMILRKLHEMLQSTADDLKLLSGELSKYHQPGIQYKTTPAPLDEEFNEKVHIEEVVNAKFYGHKVIDKTPRVPDIKPNVTNSFKSVNIKPEVKCSGVQVNTVPVSKKLSVSHTRVIHIDEENLDKYLYKKKINNDKNINGTAKVAYNELSYKYVEPKVQPCHRPLQVQQMPSIDIRSELKEQKVLQLDIIPEHKDSNGSVDKYKNIKFVSIDHKTDCPSLSINNKDCAAQIVESKSNLQPAVRKVSKMATYNSSSGSNSVSSDVQVRHKRRQKNVFAGLNSPKISIPEKHKTVVTKSKIEVEKRHRLNLEEWKKKLSNVYGSSKSDKHKTNVKSRSISKNTTSKNKKSRTSNMLNNADYIPYSKLTLGGVRVCDIEREVSDIEGKNNVPLSPIINKILSSREHSFINDSPKNPTKRDHQNMLTTSDENLLQEVIDIEKTVSETLSKNLKAGREKVVVNNISTLSDEERASYDDDFEEDKSDRSENQNQSKEGSEKHSTNNLLEAVNPTSTQSTIDAHNITYTKALSLAIKEPVDIFEFIHAIDTQDIAVQSTSSKITPKETQTSPRYERQNILPIHNDLWSPIDPREKVEKMLTLEKEFIKKLIIEEYSHVFEESLNKPSTSNETDTTKNIAAFQKNTQTSPAHVKSVMTSPARTKTRTTSPLLIHATDHQTSPIIVIDELEPKIDEDLAISINLSSPRFSLRLPQNSRDVLSILESSKDSSHPNKKHTTKTTLSTSSIDADNSSSDLSSLGEVRLKLRKFARKIPSISEFSDSSSNCNSDYQTTSILPLRSDGEISLGRTNKSKGGKTLRSDGETSVVQ